MELHPALDAAIDAGVHGHLVTLNPDGSPQVTVIWLGPRRRRAARRAPRRRPEDAQPRTRPARAPCRSNCDGVSGPGLMNYAVLHGTARSPTAVRPSCCRSSPRGSSGAGVKFPPMDNPPPGRIAAHHGRTASRGMGPWAG